MVQNHRRLMEKRFRNWTVLNLVKLAVLVDALNRETGALAEDGAVTRPDDLLGMPVRRSLGLRSR